MSSTRPNLRDVMRRVVPRPVRKALWGGSDRLEYLQQQAFQARTGVSTAGRVYLEDVGVDATNRVHYEACDWFPARRALRALHPGPGDAFVDLGAGRGQAVVIAGLLPFGRVLGIELLDNLCADATANVQRAKARGVIKAGRIDMTTADVLEWEFPDDLTVVFMYCPFTGEIFRHAMGRLFDSYDRNPRRLHIVYVYPFEHNWLLGTQRVVVADVLPAQWPAKPWWWRSGWALVTYRVVGEGEGGPTVPRVRRRLFRPRRALERWSAPHEHVFKVGRPGEPQVLSRPDGS